MTRRMADVVYSRDEGTVIGIVIDEAEERRLTQDQLLKMIARGSLGFGNLAIVRFPNGSYHLVSWDEIARGYPAEDEKVEIEENDDGSFTVITSHPDYSNEPFSDEIGVISESRVILESREESREQKARAQRNRQEFMEWLGPERAAQCQEDENNGQNIEFWKREIDAWRKSKTAGLRGEAA